MNKPDTPDFAALLAPFIGAVPEEAVPNFLALLERGAAQRYRDWAEQLPDFRDGLRRCAASEDQIADIVEGLFPIDEALASAIREPLPAARDAYYEVFEHLSLADQLAIQADAELQGAAVWRGMLAGELPAAVREGLERCSELEQESSAYLYSILDGVRAAG
ncbi:MAG: hypothetical protein HKN19_18255 [Halioglobus sp.]|nr:hypothetical protein [Halioglobus sp.]